MFRLIDWIDLVLGNMGMRLEFIVLFMLGASLVCHSWDLGIRNPFAGKTHSGKKKIHHYFIFALVVLSIMSKDLHGSWCRLLLHSLA